jgi:hypothetical protein
VASVWSITDSYVVFSSIGASALEGRRERQPVRTKAGERQTGNGSRETARIPRLIDN